MGNRGAHTPHDWIGGHSATLAAEVVSALRLPADARLHETVELFLTELEASLLMDEPSLLAEQLRWQASRLDVLAPETGVDQLVTGVLEVLRRRMDDADLGALREHVARAAATLHTAPVADAPPHSAQPQLSEATRAYLDNVLAGERDEAVRLVMGAVEGGHDVRGLLLDVLQPAQLEIGRLWEHGEITIAQEHFSTAVTELVMSLLYPHLFGSFPSGRRLVAVGVGPSGHEIGIRMVADLLGRAGWSTTYLGSGLPAEDVVEEVVRHEAHVLALSATMAGHLPLVRTLVAAVRADPRCDGVRIVVGGRVFQLAPGLFRQVGADAVARDGVDAVGVIDALVPAGTL